MNLFYVGVLFTLIANSFGIPPGERHDSLVSLLDESKAQSSELDVWLENAVDKHFGKNEQLDETEHPVIQKFKQLISDLKNVSKELVAKIRPKVVQIIKDYKWQILIKITFKDVEGLKKVIRQIAKDIIVAIDDEVIKVLIGDGYDQAEWMKVVEKWDKLPTVEEMEQMLLAFLKDFFISVANNIFEKLMDILDRMENAITEYGPVDDIVEELKKMAGKIIGGMENILGEVLQDRPFVVKELKRYKNALEIFAKRAAIAGNKMPFGYEDLLKVIQKYITGPLSH